MKKTLFIVTCIFFGHLYSINLSKAQSSPPFNTEQQTTSALDELLPPPSEAQPNSTVGSSQAGQKTDPEQTQNTQIEKNAIPLTPDMIRNLGERYKENQRVIEESSTETAMPRNRSAITVSFQPGQKTSIIMTQKGYTTAISFFDNTGSPWPIAWDTNSNNANVGNGTNCLSMCSRSRY